MAIHYDKRLKRFRDDAGRMVSAKRAMRSSVARREFEAAQRTPRLPASAKKVSHAKPPAKPRPKPRAKPKPKPRAPGPMAPWEKEGIVREYPAPDEWIPEVDFYGYDDLVDDWGDYDDEETDS